MPHPQRPPRPRLRVLAGVEHQLAVDDYVFDADAVFERLGVRCLVDDAVEALVTRKSTPLPSAFNACQAGERAGVNQASQTSG